MVENSFVKKRKKYMLTIELLMLSSYLETYFMLTMCQIQVLTDCFKGHLTDII